MRLVGKKRRMVGVGELGWGLGDKWMDGGFGRRKEGRGKGEVEGGRGTREEEN